MSTQAKTIKALLAYIKSLRGAKLGAKSAAKHLGVPQTQMWAYISFALRTGLIEEPGGKGSQVYLLTPGQKSITQTLKAEAVRLGMPSTITGAKATAWAKANRERWGLS